MDDFLNMNNDEKKDNIDLNGDDNNSEIFDASYPKPESENNSGKTKKINKFFKTFKNPLLTHFTRESHFIYDLNTVDDYISKVSNINCLKFNIEEKKCIKDLIAK